MFADADELKVAIPEISFTVLLASLHFLQFPPVSAEANRYVNLCGVQPKGVAPQNTARAG
jgi:hypothetical protein